MIQKKYLNSLVSGRNILVFSCWLLIKNSPHLYKIAYIYIYFGAALSTWYLHITGYSISSHLFFMKLNKRDCTFKYDILQGTDCVRLKK